MARSARCDVRQEAAVFVESDETTVPAEWSVPKAFRRLLLQIGGANIAGADRAGVAAGVVVARGGKNASARSSSGGGAIRMWLRECALSLSVGSAQ